MKKHFSQNQGQFFSLITIIMIIPLIALSTTFGHTLSGYGEEIGSLVRLKSAYYYYNSVDQDLLRAGEIIGRRGTVLTLKWVVENGRGLKSSSETLRELFLNGTINGSSTSMENSSTIYHWLNRTEDISENRGYFLNLTLQKLHVGMETPFEISFNLNYSLGMHDRLKRFYLKKNLSKEAIVDIRGLEDPLITLKTKGRMVYPIKRSPYSYFTKKLSEGVDGNNSWAAGESLKIPSTNSAVSSVPSSKRENKVLVIENSVDQDLMNDFAGVVVGDTSDMSGFDKPYVIGASISSVPNKTRVVVEGNGTGGPQVWEIQNLYSLWKNGYYVEGEGPSFMDRLENNLTNSYSGRGLNVFLRKDELSDVGIDIEDRPNMAHIYFSEGTTVNYRVKGMPKSFKINESNLEKFGLNNSLKVK